MASPKVLSTKGQLAQKGARAGVAKPEKGIASDAGKTRHRKYAQGVVVSDKMTKTRVVRVDRQVQDKFYKKYLTKSNKLKAHDEKNDSRVGDLVQMVETKPLSREKRWAISKIIRRSGSGTLQKAEV